MPAAVLTTSGRIAIATAIKARTAHLAWGSGDPTWTATPPDPPANTSALLAEVGRRRALQVEFCTPDPAGALAVPEGTFSITTTPTNNLYFKFHFDFVDGVGSTIRELAIYTDTVAATGVPVGQFYLLPAEVAQPGTLLVAERRAPLVREATTRHMFEYVVTF
jgi:hypothetical protein